MVISTCRPPLGLLPETRLAPVPLSAQGQLELSDPVVERFRIVLADPPWKYEHARLGRLSPDRHYPTLTTAQLAAMPVESLVGRDSLLFLWATPPLLKEALDVLAAWGFEYTTNGVWDKESLGPGFHLRQQHELLLIGKRGRPGTPSPADRIRSVIRSRRGRHSAKPSRVHKYIEKAYPDAPKIELFARAPRPGWAVWGNQVESDIHLPNPAAGTFVQGMLAL
jgi:N6-adenosine-specific RNA methylase IME4